MLSDDDHVATATVDGVALLGLDLFGTSDPDALNRLRMECHGEWAEEAAPAAYEGAAWAIRTDGNNIRKNRIETRTREENSLINERCRQMV